MDRNELNEVLYVIAAVVCKLLGEDRAEQEIEDAIENATRNYRLRHPPAQGRY